MADATLLTAVRHASEGRRDQAAALLRRVLQKDASNVAANTLLAELLASEGQPDQALFYARRAVQGAPDRAETHGTVGNILQQKGDLDGAIEAYRAAIKANAGSVPAWANLGLMLHARRRLPEAESALVEAIRLGPETDAGYGNLSLLLLETGRVGEAVDLLRRGLAARPTSAQLRYHLCFILNYDDRATPGEVFREHTAFGGLYPPGTALAPANPDPERPLRIGYLSPDFRAHSVAFFSEPIVTHHDRTRFCVACYSSTGGADATTGRFKGAADLWREVRGMDDAGVARLVRSDRVDVMVDLAGLTTGHRLGVAAARAAPVQVSMIGYPNTTGLAAVDARIVDAVTDPPGEADALATEKLVRLPGCFLCFRPPDEAPEPGPVPSAAAGHITFGSFNTLPKMNGRVVALWARVLLGVANSRLFLKAKGLDDEATRRRVLDAFGARGVGPGRIELMGQAGGAAEHLALYRRVDIGLDPFPYNGTTTTCEALWMGVPVVCLEGRVHAGRVGATLLHGAGLAELLARDEAGYERLCAGLAADPAALAQYRAELRGRVRSSGLCDARGYVARLEEAFRSLWRERCVR